jgi:alpha-glucosidase
MPWHARAIARLIDRYEGLLPTGGWPNWVLGNHDNPRIAGRVGLAQARVAAMLLLTLRGTPTIYYGDEIGMQQVAIAPEHVRDPFENNVPGIGVGRDGARTPMQWSADLRGGFSFIRPWLPLASDFRDNNVANQSKDPASTYNLYRRLLALRREHAALRIGAYQPLVASGDLLMYVRMHADERLLVALNLGAEPTAVRFDGARLRGDILLSTGCDRTHEHVERSIDLRADEGVIVALSEDSMLPH